jgi:hypothetical protein
VGRPAVDPRYNGCIPILQFHGQNWDAPGKDFHISTQRENISTSGIIIENAKYQSCDRF